MIANLSQLSKAETERIWLLFYPWLVIAGAALVDRFEFRRITLSADTMLAGWLTVQATAAILLQAALVSKW